MKKLLSIMLVVVMMLTLTACGGSSGSYSGNYVLSKAEIEGTVVQKGDDMWDLAFGDDDSKLPHITLQDDGKCSLLLDDEAENADYTVDGDKITFSSGSEKFEGTINGDEITIEEGSGKMVFSKK